MRPRRLPIGTIALVAAWALVACAPTAITTVGADRALPAFDAALARPGTASTVTVAGALGSSFGCELRYEVVEPVGWRGGVTVLLAHGFLRDLRTMRGWAEQWASHGVRTAVISFCNSTPFAGRHDRNAVDLRALADALQPTDGRVIYAGFSAGGLAALLAAADDPRTAAYLGLDAVDSGGLAARATGLDRPALFLSAEPGACNADANMLPTAAVIAPARVLRMPNATHCHFEEPYDALCERLCGRVEPAAAAEAIRTAIRALATAFVLEHGGPQ